MKKHGWLLSLATMVFVFGVTVFTLYSHASTTPEMPPGIELPQIVQAQNLPLAQTQEQLALSEQVHGLSEKWANAYQKAGWIHVVMHQIIDSDVENVRPDGQPAPNDFITEDWILLDDKGQEIKGIFTQKNMNGEVIQISVLRDGAWFNLTYGDVIPAPDNLIYTLDFGFPNVADNLKDELKKTNETMDGKTLIKFSAEEIYVSPIKVANFQSMVKSADTQAFYNENGQVELYQTVFKLQDGSERRNTVEVLTFEQISIPPNEILKYLDQNVQK